MAAPKATELFRVYSNDPADGVRQHYEAMRRNQCIEYANRVEPTIFNFETRGLRMTVREALDKLAAFVDRSDPDLALPNIQHALQTAERARAAKKPDWFIVVALVHDIGKMMYVFGEPADGMGGRADEPQWALGGDTWVLGCAIPDSAVYPELNALNPDAKHPVYGTVNGAYTHGCGIMNLRFSVGHDEYAWRWMKANDPPLARVPEAMAMLRLHSLYPWHNGGAYRQFHAPGDEALLAAGACGAQLPARVRRLAPWRW